MFKRKSGLGFKKEGQRQRSALGKNEPPSDQAFEGWLLQLEAGKGKVTDDTLYGLANSVFFRSNIGRCERLVPHLDLICDIIGDKQTSRDGRYFAICIIYALSFFSRFKLKICMHNGLIERLLRVIWSGGDDDATGKVFSLLSMLCFNLKPAKILVEKHHLVELLIASLLTNREFDIGRNALMSILRLSFHDDLLPRLHRTNILEIVEKIERDPSEYLVVTSYTSQKHHNTKGLEKNSKHTASLILANLLATSPRASDNSKKVFFSKGVINEMCKYFKEKTKNSGAKFGRFFFSTEQVLVMLRNMALAEESNQESMANVGVVETLGKLLRKDYEAFHEELTADSIFRESGEANEAEIRQIVTETLAAAVKLLWTFAFNPALVDRVRKLDLEDRLGFIAKEYPELQNDVDGFMFDLYKTRPKPKNDDSRQATMDAISSGASLRRAAPKAPSKGSSMMDMLWGSISNRRAVNADDKDVENEEEEEEDDDDDEFFVSDELRGVDNEEVATTQENKFDVMISYNWGAQDLVLKIQKALEHRGLKVWIDVDKVSGNILEQMAYGIENSHVVLFAMTSKYFLSNACHSEADYTYALRKPYIPLLCEDGFVPTGWLGILVGMQKYIDCTQDELFEKKMDELLLEIEKKTAPTEKQPVTSMTSIWNRSTTNIVSVGNGPSGAGELLLEKNVETILKLVQEINQKL